MERRIFRLNQLIKRVLSEIILKEMDFSRETLVTLTRAETTSDLRESKIFLSVWPKEKSDEIIKELKRNIYFFQRKLNEKLKMKRIPKISFFEEEKVAKAGEIERILEKLKKEKIE